MSITDKRLAALRERSEAPDAAIDFSEIPELDDAFFETATLVQPDRTEHVTLRVRKSVVDAYRRQGKGHTSRMSAVLETYAKAKLR